jgi:hypothetical protein
VLKVLLGPDAHITCKPCSYETVDSAVAHYLDNMDSKEIRLIIADITPNAESLRVLDTYRVDPVLVDHHETRRVDLEKYPWAHYSEDRCACRALKLELMGRAEKHLWHPTRATEVEVLKGAMERLGGVLRGIDAWDMWRIGSADRSSGESLNRVFRFMGLERFVSAMYMSAVRLGNISLSYHELDNVLREREEDYIDSKLKTFKQYINHKTGKTFAIVTVEHHPSEVGHAILDEHPDLDFVVLEDGTTGGLGFRSVGEFNVGSLAKDLGGGGHAHASGVPAEKGPSALLTLRRYSERIDL